MWWPAVVKSEWVPTQTWQRPVTTRVCKPEAVYTGLCSWWWAICRSKHVEPSAKVGIINSITRLHLVGYFYWFITLSSLYWHLRPLSSVIWQIMNSVNVYIYYQIEQASTLVFFFSMYIVVKSTWWWPKWSKYTTDDNWICTVLQVVFDLTINTRRWLTNTMG